MFAVGDRVVLLTDNPDHNIDLIKGCAGTVVSPKGRPNFPDECGVYWDNKIHSGHTCGSTAPAGHGWYVKNSSLELENSFEIDITAFNNLFN